MKLPTCWKVGLVLVAALLGRVCPAATEVKYPSDAPVWNVTTYGADPTGVADSTTAFEQAIDQALRGPGRYGAIRIVYVPNGTYKITRTLQSRIINAAGVTDGYDRWRAGLYIQGESQAGVILKLPDNAAGFTTASLPKPVIQTGSEHPLMNPVKNISSLTRSGSVVTVTSVAHGYTSGTQVKLSDAYDGAYNGDKIITVVNNDTFTFTVSGTPATPDTGRIYASLGSTTKPLVSLTRSGSVATATCNSHGFANGSSVTIKNAADAAYNGAKTITVTGANTFTFTVSGTPATPATGVIHVASYTEGELNEAFRHYIRNLTIDVGSGNAGAVGIDYLVHNRGGIYDVTVKSSDTNRVGHTGIRMDRQWPGPGLLKRVTVQGFETGISLRNHAQYGMTLEHITLQNQRAHGIYVRTNTLSVRGLTSANSVPAIFVEDARAHVTVVDSTFTGGVSGQNAITSTGKLYVRNLKSTGYGTTIQDQGANNRDIAGGTGTVTVSEYKSWGEHKEFAGSIAGSVQLPVLETPDFNSTNFTQWSNAVTAGATPDVNTDDDRAAIQTAIDSGKPVVYLPRGQYSVNDTIIVRGSVQKFIGLCAEIIKGSSFPANAPLIRFEGAAAPFTVLQNLRVAGDLEHNSTRSLVVANSDIRGKYSNTAAGSGHLFLEDAIIGRLDLDHPQFVWARQLNIEVTSPSFITNNGAVLWLFGYKTEGQTDYTGGGINDESVLTNNEGWTELLGGFFYPTRYNATVPMIINNEGQLSANYKKDDLTTNNFPVHVRDIQGGVTSDFLKSEAPGENNTALYSGATSTYDAAFPALANYTFASSSLASSDTDANSTAASFTHGSGYTTVGFGTGVRTVSGAGVTNYTAAQNLAAGEYFAFTLTRNGSNKLYPMTVGFGANRASSSPDRVSVYGIPTGGSNNGQTLLLLDSAVVNTVTETHLVGLLGAAWQGVTAIEFRIVFHGASQGLGTNRISNVVVKGQAIP